MIVSVEGSDARELWTAPLTGGPAVKRAAFSGRPDDRQPAVTTAFEVGDALFISFAGLGLAEPDEVHRVRADGTTEKPAW